MTTRNNRTKRTKPEIWFRPSPTLPLRVLLESVKDKRITSTARLGARNENHPKGYAEGEIATLRVFDTMGAEQFNAPVRVERVLIQPLQELTPADLQNTPPYRSWQEVQRDLSFFEKRPVAKGEEASVIGFSYL